MIARIITITTAAAFTVAGVPALSAGNPVHGSQLFGQRCAVCHSDAANAAPKTGPNLFGVVGRKSANTAFNYSPALKNLSLTWTPEELDTWLAGPGKLAPGTRMFLSTSNPNDRADVVAYLATLTAKR